LRSPQNGVHAGSFDGTALAKIACMTLPHHSLLAWQRADDLFIDLHLLSRTFPALEKYELSSQLRRSAFSVPVNIVESSSRYTGADKLHFLQIASASLAEAGYCLHAARRLGYIGDKEYERFELQIRKTAAPLRGLMKSLGRERP
jgi:four helix bundle protein